MPVQPTDRRAGANRHLSNIAQGYNSQKFVGEFVCPTVPVTTRSGLYIQFDESSFEVSDDSRAPGTPFGIVDLGYEGKPYSVNCQGLIFAPSAQEIEEAGGIGLQLAEYGARLLMEKTMLKMELERADLTTNPANFAPNNTAALSGSSQLSDPAANLSALIREAKGEVSVGIGEDPNVWLLSYEAFEAVKELETVKEKIKYTSRDSITADMLAEMFGFAKVVVGTAIAKTSQSSTKRRVWDNCMLFCYTNPAALVSGRLPFASNQNAATRQQPSFAYQYMLADRPQVTNRYWEEATDSWNWKIRSDRSSAIVGANGDGLATSGFLYTNVTA